VTSLAQSTRSTRPVRRWAPADSSGNPFWGIPLPSLRPNSEGIGSDFVSLVANAYKANSVVFACELTRMSLFSEARFQFRQIRNGRPGDLFGTAELAVLEKPWPNGTTGDLLARMCVDADLAGTAFVARRAERRDRLMRLRPDWVTMVLGSEDEPDDAGVAMDAEFLGVMYYPGGPNSGRTPIPLLADECAYWAPIPDPAATYRGMSWLNPVLAEIEADTSTTTHKLQFFRNGATPQMVVTMGTGVSAKNLRQFVAKMDDQHAGLANAYKTLYLGGGAHVDVVGRDLAQLDFKATQGAGETRIAAASGVHPVVAALSEGLAGSSLNAGNFNSARRLVADRTLRPLWRSACASLAPIISVPERAELWFDPRDISFLQEDRKDAADIEFVKAQTIRQLVDGGFEPASVIKAVEAEDMSLLVHSGRLSVQLQEPGAPAPGATPTGTPPAPPAPTSPPAAPARLTGPRKTPTPVGG
jgi:hypothetical protein